MTISRHFHSYDAGSFHGEAQRWVMCSFFNVQNGKRVVGQSELVKAEEWPSYRSHQEKLGRTERSPKGLKG